MQGESKMWDVREDAFNSLEGNGILEIAKRLFMYVDIWCTFVFMNVDNMDI